jgi:organic hydroperoxide reductase OsmC/OhrA
MAHEYKATVRWTRDGARFTDSRYSRGHVWQFDGGVEVRASSSPSVVPLPLSVAEAVDPEEAFVAALSSCQMLFFLTFAAKAGFIVERYEDAAVGTMAKNADGKFFVAKVTLNPSIVFVGERRPSDEAVADMHHRAHAECFIANSVKSDVVLGAATFSFEQAA